MYALRRLEPHDDEDIAAILNDPLTRFWNPAEDADGVEKWREANDDWTDFRTWAVVDAADDLVGIVSVYAIDESSNHAEIGFRTHPAYRGRGVARTAVELACLDLAADGQVHRLSLWHAIENVASCKVALACGFEVTEYLKANCRYGDGELHDEHRHIRDVTPSHRGDPDY